MIIVAGWLRVAAADRERYLEDCLSVISAARNAPGCVAFSVSADPLEPDLINVFEQWESLATLEQFRGSGPADVKQSMVVAADVSQHEIAESVLLT